MARVGAYTLARDACRRSHVRPSCSVTSDVDDVAFPTSTSNMRAYARLAEWALRIQPRAPHNSLYRHVYTQCCVHSYTCIVGTCRRRVVVFRGGDFPKNHGLSPSSPPPSNYYLTARSAEREKNNCRYDLGRARSATNTLVPALFLFPLDISELEAPRRICESRCGCRSVDERRDVI